MKCMLLLLAAALVSQEGDPVERLEFIRLSYKANKESFRYVNCHFDYTTAEAASTADAEAGIFANPVKALGYYAFDGDDARYELVVDADGMAARSKKVNERKVSSSVESFRSLTDGKDTLMDGIFLDFGAGSAFHKPSIFPGVRMFYKHFDFPLYVGSPTKRDYDLDSDLSGVKDGRATLLELQDNVRLGDSTVCLVKFRFAAGERTYWVDISRGCVPLRMLNHSTSGSDTLTVNSALTMVTNAGWIPRRKLHVIQNGRVVRDLLIRDIDAERRPDRSTFALDFEKPLRIVDQPKSLGYAPRSRWSLLDRPSPGGPGVRPVTSASYIPPPELPEEDSQPFPWMIMAVGSAGFLLSIVAATFVRRRFLLTGA